MLTCITLRPVFLILPASSLYVKVPIASKEQFPNDWRLFSWYEMIWTCWKCDVPLCPSQNYPSQTLPLQNGVCKYLQDPFPWRKPGMLSGTKLHFLLGGCNPYRPVSQFHPLPAPIVKNCAHRFRQRWLVQKGSVYSTTFCWFHSDFPVPTQLP